MCCFLYRDKIHISITGAASLTRTNTKKLDRVRCSQCTRMVTRRWLKHHQKLHNINTRKDITSTRHHHTLLVDRRRGIYASTTNLSGRGHPVHVQKIYSNAQGANYKSFCEHTSCMQAYEAAQRGSNPCFECVHMRSVQFAKATRSVILTSESLQAMVAGAVITAEKSETLLQLQNSAFLKHAPFIIFLPNDVNRSDNYYHFSVFTGVHRYWSKMDRTIVTFEKRQK